MTSSALARRLFRPVDGASLAAFRILYGTVMFGALVRLLGSGWIGPLFTQPTFTFKYPGFEWVPVPPHGWVVAQVVVLAVLAAFIATGFLYRVACVLFVVGFAWLELIDVTNYLNHYYLVAILALVLAVLPAGRVWSVDGWLGLTRRTQTVPAWAVYLVRFQVGVVYFFAGLAKFGTDWLLHAQPLSIWMTARTDTPIIGPLLAEPAVAWAMSWAGFLYDTTIVLWLSLRRTRPFAYAVLIVFHLLTGVFFNIGIFPWLMTTAALIFFPFDWPRRLLRRPALPEAETGGADVEQTLTPWRRAGLAVAGLWCAFHVLVPLRHYAYPGDVIWNEEGMRWSWKVMLREKQGSVTYLLRDPASGREWQVSPSEYLNARQAKEMSGQPDLIVQLAHHIGEEARRRGIRDPEVRVDALVSLNGRPAARLIDPEVDLMKVRPGLARATWILPEPEVPPLSPLAGRRARSSPARAEVVR